MTLIAAVSLAAVANANAIQWGALAVTPSVGAACTADYTAYFFIAGDTSDTLKSYVVTMSDITGALDKGDTSVLSKAIDQRGAAVVSQTGYANFANAAIPKVAATAGSTVTAFAIIVDGTEDNYLVAKLNGTGDALISKTVAATSSSDYLFGYGAQVANTGWQSVPEPTSGLLLLLGVAGLALRRRRA